MSTANAARTSIQSWYARNAVSRFRPRRFILTLAPAREAPQRRRNSRQRRAAALLEVAAHAGCHSVSAQALASPNGDTRPQSPHEQLNATSDPNHILIWVLPVETFYLLRAVFQHS